MPCPRCSANCPNRLRSIFAPAVDASTDNSTVCDTAKGAVRVIPRKATLTRTGWTTSSLLCGNRMRIIAILGFSRKLVGDSVAAILRAARIDRRHGIYFDRRVSIGKYSATPSLRAPRPVVLVRPLARTNTCQPGSRVKRPVLVNRLLTKGNLDFVIDDLAFVPPGVSASGPRVGVSNPSVVTCMDPAGHGIL